MANNIPFPFMICAICRKEIHFVPRSYYSPRQGMSVRRLTMRRALIFAKLCRVRKTTDYLALQACARRLSVTKWKKFECHVFRLCFYQNGICDTWGRCVLSVIISID